MHISYLTAGGREFASSRLRAFKVADALAQRGHEVGFAGVETETDVLIVQKRTDLGTRYIMEQAREWGCRIIYDVDDWMHGHEDLADIITVDTRYKLQLFPNAVVIPDCLDVEPDSPVKTGHSAALRRVVWYGNADNVYHTDEVAKACARLKLEFRIITDLGRLTVAQVRGLWGVQWQIDRVDAEIVDCDLVVCPYLPEAGVWSREWVLSKSANRILKAWALGMPVAGTPIPSYIDAGLCYRATTAEEWMDVLHRLSSQTAREEDAARGREVAVHFSAEKVAEQWLKVMIG